MMNLFYYIATVIKDIVPDKAWKGGSKGYINFKSFFLSYAVKVMCVSLHEFNRREKGNFPLISKTSYWVFFLAISFVVIILICVFAKCHTECSDHGRKKSQGVGHYILTLVLLPLSMLPSLCSL